MTSRFFIVLALLLTGAAPSYSQLPEAMRTGLREAQIPEDAVGLIVLRLADGAPVLMHREKESMQPASTIKLLTSLVALETLGPAYRARTQLLVAGEIVDGVVKGDVVLRGGGDVEHGRRFALVDPFFASPEYERLCKRAIGTSFL